MWERLWRHPWFDYNASPYLFLLAYALMGFAILLALSPIALIVGLWMRPKRRLPDPWFVETPHGDGLDHSGNH